MLDPRWRKVLRDGWLHRGRTLLAVVAIAVGVAGAGTVLNAWSLVQRVTREEYRASNPASATLRTDSIDAALLSRVRAVPGVSLAAARTTVIGAARTGTGWHTATLFVVDDFTAMRIGLVRPEVGDWPPIDGQFVIERSSLDFAAAAVGQPITVAVGDGKPVVLPVGGIARDVGLAPGWMEHVVYGFVTRATIRQLGAPASLDQLQLVVRDRSLDREGVRRIAYQVKAIIEATGRSVSSVDVPEPGEHIHAGQMDSLLFTQGAFGVIALVLSGFLVVNLIAAMLAGQVREIGVMKTIGARPGQIAAMYLALALLLGLVASSIGVPVAVLIGRRYAALKAELLNFDVAGYSIPFGPIGLQLLVGVLLPVVAAAFPVIHGCRISVGDALRDFGIGHGRADRESRWIHRIGGLRRPVLLSLRNAFRRRQRMVLTLFALAAGGSVYLGAANLRASIRASADLLFAPHRYDVMLRIGRAAPPESIAAPVRSVPGVAQVEAWAAVRAAVWKGENVLGNGFAITAPPIGSSMLAYPLSSGRWFEPGDGNALVVTRGLQRDEPALEVGSKTTLVIRGRKTEWTVVGVVEAGPTTAAYAARETVATLIGSRDVDLAVVSIGVAGAGAEVELIQRLRAELGRAGLPVGSSQLLAENRRVMEEHLLMVVDFLAVMGWLMIAVGGLGLASTMSLGVLERTREIGIMRAIGARHGSILAIVQIEGLVIATLSWVIAIPLSLPMSALLARAFSRIMIPVPVVFVPPPQSIGFWLLLVVVVSLIACTWPALQATRVTTAAALAYE